MSRAYYKEWRKLKNKDAASDDSSESDVSGSGSDQDETISEDQKKSSKLDIEIDSQLSSEIDLPGYEPEPPAIVKTKIEDFPDEIPLEAEIEEFENGSLMNTVPDATGLNFLA